MLQFSTAIGQLVVACRAAVAFDAHGLVLGGWVGGQKVVKTVLVTMPIF